jgi:hypothetical protein
MNTYNVPATAGKKVRALLLSALLLSMVAGALFVPVMADSDSDSICGIGPEGNGPNCRGLIADPVLPPWWYWLKPLFPFPLPTYPI